MFFSACHFVPVSKLRVCHFWKSWWSRYVRSRVLEPFENLGGGEFSGYSLPPPLIEIGLTGLPKSRGVIAPLSPRFLRPCIGVPIFGLYGFQLVQKMVALSVTIKYTILISNVLERKAQECKINFSKVAI